MKKKLLCLVSCFFVFFLISCSSIPKKANADDAIVIGEVSIFFPEDDLYAGNHDTKASGSIRNGIEVAIENTKSKKLISTRTDEKGFFVFKNLNPNSSYRIVDFCLFGHFQYLIGFGTDEELDNLEINC